MPYTWRKISRKKYGLDDQYRLYEGARDTGYFINDTSAWLQGRVSCFRHNQNSASTVIEWKHFGGSLEEAKQKLIDEYAANV